VYSLPFVIQPLANGFRAIDTKLLEAAAVLGAAPLERFISIVVPLVRPAFLASATLGFAHTVGEFGVVLMIGGNLPGETRVVSIAVYDHVEQLDYGSAHLLSAGLLVFSTVVLVIVYASNRRFRLLGP
jgi:molybdate transport system permease protein